MLLTQIDAVTDEVEAIPLHSMEISLHPKELFAELTNTQLGVVTYGGNVTIERPLGIDEVEVSLTADCTRGWPTVISPTTLVFTESGTERFTVTVIVPPATPPVSGTVTATAVAHSQIWDETAYAEATASVLQYYQFRIWIDGNTGEGTPGGTIGGTITIFNNGTGEDRFLISLESAPDMISVDVENSISIPSKFEMDVQFTLTISDDYDPPMEGEIYAIIFRVESEGARNTNLLMAHTEPYYIQFPSLSQQLEENWPTYVGYGVAVALLVAITVLILRRRRRGRSETVESMEEHSQS